MLFEECLVQVGLYQGSLMLPQLFVIALDEISENAREGLINEILYADHLVLTRKSMKNLREKLSK